MVLGAKAGKAKEAVKKTFRGKGWIGETADKERFAKEVGNAQKGKERTGKLARKKKRLGGWQVPRVSKKKQQRIRLLCRDR